MDTELVVALVSAGAVVLAAGLGALGALIGTSRRRLPRQLQQAKNLSAGLESMTKGSAEQRLVRDVHDDLVVEWALRQADHSYDELITAARPLIVFGSLLSVGGLAGVLGVAVAVTLQFPSGVSTKTYPEWASNIGAIAAAMTLVGIGTLIIGALMYLLGRGGHVRNMNAIRSAHNLRNTVRAQNDAAMAAHRSQRRTVWASRFTQIRKRYFGGKSS
ncbi:hypothetical protein [Microbacterium kyungheense]|uniref:hypothetical protein n=1 Tax=Microbacterium kyungheense TaxID=1263636 RepID=UPI00114F4DB5|nr:hypothetical protein [Microbacterium kyungheense]